MAPGYTAPSLFASGGNPYGTSVSVDQNNNIVWDVQAFQNGVPHQTKRVNTIAERVEKGMQ